MKRMATHRSVVKSAFMGLAVALILTLVGAMVIAKLVSNEMIQEEGNVWVFAIRLVSVLAGCVIGYAMTGQNRLLLSSVISAGYLGVLFLIALGFGDGIKVALTGIISILLGGGMSLILGLIGKGNGAAKTKFKRFR